MIIMNLRTTAEKLQTVLDKNTYYFRNELFEDEMKSHVNNITCLVMELGETIKQYGCTKEVLDEFLVKDDSLIAVLGVTGISFEMLQRIVTIIRKENFEEFDTIFYKDKWSTGEYTTAWGASKIQKMVKKNKFFRKALVNVFFDGEDTLIGKMLPPFLSRRMSSTRIQNIPSLTEETIDILIGYKERGSYAAKKGNNAETVLKDILDRAKLTYDSGCDLPLLAENEHTRKRTMDFMIPNKQNPLLIIESSFSTTTSSGNGDKAKAENGVNPLNKKYYPNATFVGFVDGVGWVTRTSDAERMCEGFDDVFTFHADELKRFTELLKQIFPQNFDHA